MALSLNKIFFLTCFLFSFGLNAQEERVNDKDYHDESFKKFGKRTNQVAAWQIQNLKFGALVVRLQTNQRKIDAYRKIGQEKQAREVIAQTQFYNKLMIRAYIKKFDFCKVYFMYANYSDSLLKGVRKGIFIDSTLSVNPSIEMTEKFYMLAEKDHVYNSSIGFIKEDTAKYVTESGNTSIEAAMVLKNKYGHQLKSPFPFYIKRSYRKSSSFYVQTGRFQIDTGVFDDVEFTLSKDIKPEKQERYLEELNRALYNFYNRAQGTQVNDDSLKPFLY